MELFRAAQPDLSLQISPPNSSSGRRRRVTDDEEDMDLGIRIRRHNLALEYYSPNDTTSSSFEFELANPMELFDHSCRNGNLLLPRHHEEEFDYLRPIRGIPVCQNPPISFAAQAQQPRLASTTTLARSPFLSKFPTKRSTARAPRMRWTTTLHARFLRSVQLLGGHQRATPKSVLELMDVKDLTLAHVKSHLQMYRTIKTTDRPAISSGQSMTGENSEDNIIKLQYPGPGGNALSFKQGTPIMEQDLWSNSPRDIAWLHGRPRDIKGSTTPSEDIVKYERVSEKKSSSILEMSPWKPNLEFTLGRS